MNCEKAQLLMIPKWMDDLSITDKENQAFKAHLLICLACKEEYEKTEQIQSLVKKHWGPLGEKTRNLLEKAGHLAPVHRQTSSHHNGSMTVEEAWQDLLSRCPDLAQPIRGWINLHSALRKVNVIAACLAIGTLTLLAFFVDSKPEITRESIFQKVFTALKPSIIVELVSDTGNIPVPVGQQITSHDNLSTLLINGKHRMVVNTRTTLSIRQMVENGQVGCLVKLTEGQIYTHVKYDGNPFIVDTIHGKAVITGTTFDVKVTDEHTTLVVREGTVQFESDKGVVQVAAGQSSEITGQSAPSIPLSCDITELTAWATDYKAKPASAQAESNIDPWELALPLRKEPVALEETDYNQWIEQKRVWFKQNFPWIFQLKEALAKEGIKVDYPILLIETGDVWQFLYSDAAPDQFSVIDPTSLLKLASNFGFDKQWLLENVPAVKSVLKKPVLSENNLVDLKAFERWHKYFDQAVELEPPALIYSFRAGKYLAETRSLIWFSVRDGRYELTDQDRTEVLALLQEAVSAAFKCQDEILYPQGNCKLFPDEDNCQQESNDVFDLISAIYECERKLAENFPALSLTTRQH